MISRRSFVTGIAAVAVAPAAPVREAYPVNSGGWTEVIYWPPGQIEDWCYLARLVEIQVTEAVGILTP